MQDVTQDDRKWIFSARLDFIAHVLPVLAGLALGPLFWRFVEPNELPLWGYLVIVVFCDVGHVWGTIFRTYLDTEENGRRWALYNLSPVALFAGMFLVHYTVSEAYFWMFVGYLAIFHFIRQQWGFLCLYRARAGEADGRMADCLVHLAGALGPILWWHSSPDREFDWFMRDDPFLVRIPPEVGKPVAVALWGAALGVYCVMQVAAYRAGTWNEGKCACMAGCWVTWAFGVLFPHKLVALLFLNMFHAAPSYMIVYFTARNKWRLQKPPTDAERFVRWCTLPGRWPYYLAFFVTIAVVEEVIWELFIWRDYFPDVAKFELTPLGKSFFTALLSLPQVVHYFLDAFIWKIESNPGLSDHLGLTYTVPTKKL
ncbi:hypothetical protein DIPPA_09702 [Diplonema papillatum]|nr:hypothetical protein DIPPA_09702 [Diplonema papillatum]